MTAGSFKYNPGEMTMSWTVDAEFLCRGLTDEQEAEARRIIEENRNRGLMAILQRLGKAGFRGERSHPSEGEPVQITINSKI